MKLNIHKLCPICVVTGAADAQYKYHDNIEEHKDFMIQHMDEAHQIFQLRPLEETQEKNEEEKKAGGTGKSLTRQNAIKFSKFFENSFNEVFSYLTHFDNTTGISLCFKVCFVNA